jgi:phosphatidylinositol alpha-1,6-mannosyltransferase
VLDAQSLRQHISLARDIVRKCRTEPTVVHCGRAQPEGLPALLARALPPHPRYLFWVHGEDVTTALTSRDFAWTMRRVHAGASLAIANSHNSARVLVENGFDSSRIRVVHPGVDNERFRPDLDARDLRNRFGAGPGRLLVSVGRLQRRKGHDSVLAAMHALRSELPDLVYVIVGDGVERMRLESLARELQLEGRVHFEGEIPASLLPRYYSAADVFILPTRVDEGDFEGFGLVFLEAAATGTPVIAGRSGGVPEAVADGETGLLVDPTSTSELAQAIRTLVTTPHLGERLGQAGRARVLRQFSWNRAADLVAAIHAELTVSNVRP